MELQAIPGESFVRRNLQASPSVQSLQSQNVSNRYVKNDNLNMAGVDQLILKEATKMVEFDDLPRGSLEKLLKKLNRDSGFTDEALDILNDEDYTIEDLKMSTLYQLRDKLKYAQDINLWQRDANQQQLEMSKSNMKSMRKRANNQAQKLKKLSKPGSWLWELQARFGSTVASFFKFMRGMIFLNLLNACIVMGMIMIPALLKENDEVNEENNVGCLHQNVSNTFYFPDGAQHSYCCSKRYENISKSLNCSSIDTCLKDVTVAFLTGTEWMENSYLFYGHYQGTFSFEFNNFLFDFPLIYFLTLTFIFLMNLTVIVVISRTSIKNQIEDSLAKEDGRLGLFPIIFGSWDYSITYVFICWQNSPARRSCS